MSAAGTFPLWSSTVTVVTRDPGATASAVREVRSVLHSVEMAASRFRPDSELVALRAGVDQVVSALLADLIEHALEAARATDGLVDPTIANTLVALGYDRSIEQIPAGVPPVTVVPAVAGWRCVDLQDRHLRLPPGVALDLGATTKARAADIAAARAAVRVGSGVLVSIGGDIATADTTTVVDPTGWQVLVQDSDEDPPCQVTLAPGCAVATSSTVRRSWRRGSSRVHHIVDPRTAAPADPVWRSVTVAASTCVEANTASTAAVVLGHRAHHWLAERGYAARLVDQRRRIVRVGEWPTEVAV